jgi:hypothetical protein
MTEERAAIVNATANYPMLTASDKSSTQYHGDDVVVAPVPDAKDETEHLLSEQETEEESPPGKARRFVRALKRKIPKRPRFRKLRVTDGDDESPPPLNPEPHTELTGIAKLVSENAPVNALLKANFNVDKMYEHDIGLDTLHDANYTLRQVHELLPEWHQLKNAGFTKALLGDKWHIDQLVILYGTRGFGKPEICGNLNFTIDDFMLARTTKEQYAELGIDASLLVKMGIDFEHLFSMHMPFEQFIEEFNLTKEHIRQLNLTQHQARTLAVTRGWNMIALEEHLGMEEDEIEAFGVGLTLDG